MSTSNDTTVFIYVLQRISDKQYLYVGSATNPHKRFLEHRSQNPYKEIRDSFESNDIRYVVIAVTDELRRIDIEHMFWRQFVEAGYPIVNTDPAAVGWQYGHSSWNKGKNLSDETKQKMSERRKGVHLSEEAKRKVSVAQKGKPKSVEHRQKLSESNKGKSRGPVSDETRKKLSNVNKGKSPPNKGKSMSEEQKRKISDALKGKKKRHSTQS